MCVLNICFHGTALILDGITLTAAFQCAGVMVVIHHPKKSRIAPVIRKSSAGGKFTCSD